MKTILITGCSSGYGLATARLFLDRGWNVVATMRAPREDALPRSERLRVLALDVTDARSIAAAVDAAGDLDALVNNAGIGLMGAFEATPMATTREVFETNTFGTMAMTQAVLPGMRQRGSGVAVNVTSSATLTPYPLVAAYAASKTAIEGFTESLALELRPLGIRAKLVEPGYGPDTRFGANAGSRMDGLITPPYADYARDVFAELGKVSAITHPSDVAEVVWTAVHDATQRLRYPAGADAVAAAAARRGARQPAEASASGVLDKSGHHA